MSREVGARVGDVEVGHGHVTVLLLVHSRWPGAAQLTPDEADAVADQLRDRAALVRRINERDQG